MTAPPRHQAWHNDGLRVGMPIVRRIVAFRNFRRAWLGLTVCALLGTAASLAAEDREKWQQPDRVMQDLSLKAGTRVADIGCGRGYFTFRLSDAVGPQGKVFAVDVDQEALGAVREQSAREHRTNIEVVADVQGAGLPAGSVDAVLLCLVLHEVPAAQRLPLVQSAVRAVKPGGLLFIVDWRKSHDVKFDPYEKLIPREDLLKMCTGQGLVLDAEFHYLKYQVFLRFRKPS